ncbi:ribokinase [Devosia sp.]|jgi:ribokinase|uniref:ribokinase n=1 Tax=Devosia sp. TaxID=1871048 RepID=UPI0037BEA07E
MKQGVAILGIFVADLAFRAGRMPAIGETIAGSGFAMGPGGKGSNQAVAAARAGAKVSFISRIGADDFGAVARATWQREGIVARVVDDASRPTGAAFIYVNDTTGENAIIVVPGAAAAITAEDVSAVADAITAAAVFVTQLEQPVAAAQRGLEIARGAGVTTIFNPAPAEPVPDAIYRLCDYVTPNESEAALLTGIPVTSLDDARRAGDVFLSRRVGTALITLGENGALLHSRSQSLHVPAFNAGPVVETAGAGDAFNGGFAAALARGEPPDRAARFASALAGISVTRPGTAPSMPMLAEVEALLARG